MQLRKLFPLVVMLPLAACATTMGSNVTTKAMPCTVLEPIRWSANDTDETIKQIKGHNAAWKAVCKGK